MPDVRMPDGTIIRNVPANATRDQILAAHERAKAAGAVQDNRPTSWWQGVAEGAHRAMNNTIKAADAINPLMWAYNAAMKATGHDQPALPQVLDRAFYKSRAASPYQGSTAGKVAGGVLATAPAMAIPGGPIVQGGVGGAMLSEGHSPQDVARDVAFGMAGGKLGDMAGRYVVAPVANAALKTKAGSAVANAIQQGVSALKDSAALKYAPRLSAPESTLANASDDLARTQANLADAQRLGLPYALADATPKTRALAGSVARKSTDARQLAEDTFGPRQLEQGDRAIQAVRTHLSPTTDIKIRANELQDAANANSRPLYDKAMEGGSMAPLKSQLTDAFNQSSRAVSEAEQELAAAQRAATVSKARVSRAGDNVYTNARALPADREADAAIKAAEAKLAAARANNEQTLSLLRVSQGDAAANAPGAIWNPRIQQFLDDPIGKPGMARGLETQRLENLAEGKPFNPTEYAITGMDEAGNPVVGIVPNMRTLDAYKKGLDGMIADETDDFGRLSQRGRALVMVKNSLLGEIDPINDEYRMAREAYGSMMGERDALLSGAKATTKAVTPEQMLEHINGVTSETGQKIGGMTPEQLAQYRTGFASQHVDNMSNATDSSNPWNAMTGGINRRAKLEALFPEGAPDFNRIAQLEGDMGKTAYETIGGSPTAARFQADQLLGNGLDVPAIAGGLANPKQGLAKLVLQKLQDQVRTGGENKAAAIAPMLFDTNPGNALALLDMVARKKAAILAQQQAYGRLAVPGAVAFGAGLSTQP